MLGKSKLNCIEALISIALIDLVISHDELVLINNVLKEYNEMKKKKNPKFKDFIEFIKNFRTMLLYCLKCRKSAESKNPKLGRTINRRIKCTVYNVQCVKCTMYIVQNVQCVIVKIKIYQRARS